MEKINLDSLNSSPFFDLILSNSSCDESCRDFYHIFHRFEGINTNNNYYQIDIDRIYGYKFCYNKKEYKDLLNNGQIIKKGEQCGNNYSKDCGIIDSLEQHLCIESYENCPLYDVGIKRKNEADNKNKEHYIYNKEGNIYYNDDTYNAADKKIIGKLILSDGQPCIKEEEKL